YFINGLEWSGMWPHANIDPFEDFLDGIWPIAWFFLFYAYLMDIGQKDIRLSEERFRTVFEAAPLGVAIANAEGTFVRVNDNFCRSLGYRHSEMLEKTFMEITHPKLSRSQGLEPFWLLP
ncbi:MAG: PAS domain S-box protein, partial [Candidatus Saccharimonadales bacterium]|nr:PAS domain S-box protein [Candidatus Saccharimonadales bacterium]